MFQRGSQNSVSPIRRCAAPAPQDQKYAAGGGGGIGVSVYQCIGARVLRSGPQLGVYRRIGANAFSRRCLRPLYDVWGLGPSIHQKAFHQVEKKGLCHMYDIYIYTDIHIFCDVYACVRMFRIHMYWVQESDLTPGSEYSSFGARIYSPTWRFAF